MQRWIGIGAAFVLTVAVVSVFLKPRPPAAKPAAETVNAAPAAPLENVAKASPAEAPSDSEAAAESKPAAALEGAGRFNVLPDGSPVPPLPEKAPRSVSFGVILFAYKGAEYAPEDAPSREQALAKARAVLKDAETNFGEAVKKGDRGSVADAGRIPRGVLERSVEYALFTLPKGTVAPEPIDTPRGFWVVRRND